MTCAPLSVEALAGAMPRLGHTPRRWGAHRSSLRRR